MGATNYRLEYNQKQGLFHFEDIEKNNKKTNGWVCICDTISQNQCIEFTDIIDEKYSSDKDYPTTETIKAEFVKFLQS